MSWIDDIFINVRWMHKESTGVTECFVLISDNWSMFAIGHSVINKNFNLYQSS